MSGGVDRKPQADGLQRAMHERLQELKATTAAMTDDQVIDGLVAADYRLYEEIAPDGDFRRRRTRNAGHVYCTRTWTRAGLRHQLAVDMLVDEIARAGDD